MKKVIALSLAFGLVATTASAATVSSELSTLVKSIETQKNDSTLCWVQAKSSKGKDKNTQEDQCKSKDTALKGDLDKLIKMAEVWKKEIK